MPFPIFFLYILALVDSLYGTSFLLQTIYNPLQLGLQSILFIFVISKTILFSPKEVASVCIIMGVLGTGYVLEFLLSAGVFPLILFTLILYFLQFYNILS